MTQYNDVLNELQYYILNEDNIKRYLSQKIKTNKNMNDVNTFVKQKVLHNNNNCIFFPKEKDSLFWCFFILKFGYTKYELMYNKNEISSRQIKIEYVEKIRKEKQLIKTHKFDTFSNIENNLANEQFLNVKTFLTLCVLENLNILFVNNKCYYESLVNDTDSLYVIYASNNNKYFTRYGYKIDTTNEVDNIRSTLYKLDNIDKPIKALSSYKVCELIEICNKLSIEIKNADGKNKSKNELYELIIQYLK